MSETGVELFGLDPAPLPPPAPEPPPPEPVVEPPPTVATLDIDYGPAITRGMRAMTAVLAVIDLPQRPTDVDLAHDADVGEREIQSAMNVARADRDLAAEVRAGARSVKSAHGELAARRARDRRRENEDDEMPALGNIAEQVEDASMLRRRARGWRRPSSRRRPAYVHSITSTRRSPTTSPVD